MEFSIKLSEYAKRHNIHYATALSWFSEGKIENSYKSSTGSIFVKILKESSPIRHRIICYCRVSNQSRKSELQYQVDRCVAYCNAKGYSVDATYKEVASGMNENRKELWKAINSSPTIVVIENKDRLTRFGFKYLKTLLEKQGCEIEVLNPSDNDEQDLIKDMISIVTSFCCRLYGLRRTKNKLNKLKELLNDSQ
jgi:putative resolvase